MQPEWDGLLARPTVIVAAHPDDDIIGMGGVLPALGEVTAVLVTDGAPRSAPEREEYARTRRREWLAALALAGVGEDRTREIGVADQEASLHLEEIAAALAEILRETRPAAVVTHPYEGGHPDHDATAFAVHAAARGAAPLQIVEFTSYHSRGGALESGVFLPGGEPVTEIHLSAADRVRKQRMFECHASQAEMLRNFEIGVERFRPAPLYDFTAPPHPGRLFYEQFDWGMTGERFRALATRALEAYGRLA